DAWLDEVREPAGEEDDSTPAWLLDAELEEEMAGWPEEESEARPAVDIPSWLQDLEDEEPADDLLTEEGLPGWLANLVDADAGSLAVQEEEPAAESSPPPPEPAGEAPSEEDDFAAWLAQMDVDQPAAETT